MRMIGFVAVCLLLMSSLALAQQDRERNREGGTSAVVLEGDITQIDTVNLQIVVNDVTIQVTPDTVIEKQKVAITFADLKVGMTVKVKGKYDEDILVACKICVKECECTYEEIEGEIDAIDAVNMQIEVDGVIVQITDDTVIKKKGQPFLFEDLEVGMTVKVKGEYDGLILNAMILAVCGGCGGGGGCG